MNVEQLLDELAKGFDGHADRAKVAAAAVPQTGDETNVRRHVRLRGIEDTWRAAAESLRAAAGAARL